MEIRPLVHIYPSTHLLIDSSVCTRFLFILQLQQCSKESIHQLVLNAENLVREEVFLQQNKKTIQQQQLTQSSRRHHSHPQQHNFHHQATSNRSCPVLTTTPPPHSAKCNGGSNSNYHRSDGGAVAMAAMKVNSSSTPVKKSTGSGSVGSSARKCDQLKIKLVQVRPVALLESRPHSRCAGQ